MMSAMYFEMVQKNTQRAKENANQFVNLGERYISIHCLFFQFCNIFCSFQNNRF